MYFSIKIQKQHIQLCNMAQESKIDFETQRKDLQERKKNLQKLLDSTTDKKDRYMEQLGPAWRTYKVFNEIFCGEYLRINEELMTRCKEQMEFYIFKHQELEKDIKASKLAQQTLQAVMAEIENEIFDLDLEECGGIKSDNKTKGTAGNVKYFFCIFLSAISHKYNNNNVLIDTSRKL